jgi:hypothetical protein
VGDSFFVCVGDGFVEHFGGVCEVFYHHGDGLIVKRRHFI